MSGRRTFNEIRNLIQEALRKRPRTKHELSVETKLHKVTIDRHLEDLRLMGVVRPGRYRLRRGEQELWELSR